MPAYSHYFRQLDIGKQPRQETQTPQRQALSDQDDPWCERHDQALTYYSKEKGQRGWYAHYDMATRRWCHPRC